MDNEWVFVAIYAVVLLGTIALHIVIILRETKLWVFGTIIGAIVSTVMLGMYTRAAYGTFVEDDSRIMLRIVMILFSGLLLGAILGPLLWIAVEAIAWQLIRPAFGIFVGLLAGLIEGTVLGDICGQIGTRLLHLPYNMEYASLSGAVLASCAGLGVGAVIGIISIFFSPRRAKLLPAER